ncbi:aminotransferase class I/II-fold pyridoxal phosphate-dependent enzyme [Paenibacillus turpanensis]|uniref:MocR-like pyridoxine biosynthesis transcription factor PdxR n=1 Tax=Paenibacillus turpanensis TaxID=2689078 RepID=UPI0014078F7F
MVWFTIDRQSSVPLIHQIYIELSERILRGELKAGAAIPSSRQLAAELHVSRNVVLQAYDQLQAEGYIESQYGSGTFVSEGASFPESGERMVEPFIPEMEVLEMKQRSGDSSYISFRSGTPALDLFPRSKWARLAQRIILESPESAFGYGQPEGREELRKALTAYLLRSRGVRCHPSQLVITSGATQAISLIGRLLGGEGRTAILEDPITRDIQTIFASLGAQLHPIPVDEQGMLTQQLPSDYRPSFIYLTPSHQFPTGGTLPIQRRIQLIEYARTTGCYLVEDDYDSEFRYEGAPVSALQGLEPDKVIYIGTLSKILSPALRMGYIIFPHPLIEKGRRLKWFSDLHTPSLEQLTLAHFIEEGHLERHVLKMKRVYRKRRDMLIRLLKETFGEQVTIRGQGTGLHLIADFQGIQFTEELLAELDHEGVGLQAVEKHAMEKGKREGQVILGFGHLTELEMALGLRILKKVMLQYE